MQNELPGYGTKAKPRGELSCPIISSFINEVTSTIYKQTGSDGEGPKEGVVVGVLVLKCGKQPQYKRDFSSALG